MKTECVVRREKHGGIIRWRVGTVLPDGEKHDFRWCSEQDANNIKRGFDFFKAHSANMADEEVQGFIAGLKMAELARRREEVNNGR